MKAVMKHVMQRRQAFAELPLFQFMRDESLSPEVRLGFYPVVAHFVLSFGDFNKYVLRETGSTDRFQQMVNAHTEEDDHHWLWYLEDFTKLGFDTARPPSEWMRFMWSDRTVAIRLMTVRLATLVHSAQNSLERMGIVEAIEQTGNVLFSASAGLAERIRAERSVQLLYWGQFHLNKEDGHAVNADLKELCAVELPPESRARTLKLVDGVFDAFTAVTHEMLAFASRDLPRGTVPLTSTLPATPELRRGA